MSPAYSVHRFSALIFMSLAWILLWSSRSAIGSDGNYQISRIDGKQGLSESHVYCILQDKKGFIWFGTRDGLNRFDGYNMKVYRNNPRDPQSLSNNYVYAILEDSKGRIWVGTMGGLNRFDPEQETFTRYVRKEHGSSLSHDTIRGLAEDPYGPKSLIYIATSGGGLNSLDPETGEFVHYVRDDEKEYGLLSNDVRSLKSVPQGLMVGTTRGLCFMARDRPGRFIPYFRGRVTAMTLDQDQNVWFGSLNDLYYLKLGDLAENETLTPIRLNPEGKPLASRIYALAMDGDILLVGTRNGLFSLDGKGGISGFWEHNPSYAFSLAHNFVRSIYVDPTGIRWIGSFGNGVSKMIATSFKLEKGARAEVISVLKDGRGDLWMGKVIKGLERHMVNGEKREYRIPGATDDTVSALFEDSRGTIWIGTAERGLTGMNPDTEAIVNYQRGMANGLFRNRIRSLYESPLGDLWVATSGALSVMNLDKPGVFTNYRPDHDNENSLSSGNLICFWGSKDDPSQALWIGSWYGGLNRMDLGKPGVFESYQHQSGKPDGLSANTILHIYGNGDGRLWIGTTNGLNRFDPATGRSQAWFIKDGLPSNTVYCILPDAQGRLWLSTTRGLSLFDPKTERFKNYDRQRGVAVEDFRAKCGLRDEKGRLYFGGVGGLVSFHPGRVTTDRDAPQMVLTRIDLDNKPQTLKRLDPNSPLERRIEDTTELNLSYRHRSLDLYFSALHFKAPLKNQYAYRLDGYDEQWIHTGAHDRRAAYMNLKPKTYVFRVKGASRDGVWSEEAQLTLILPPPPWRTWWAWSLYGVVLVSLIVAYVRNQARKLQKANEINEQLKQVDRLKDEFMANTSHELRTPLNGIIGLAESLVDGAAGPVNPVQKKNLAMLADSGKRLANLVDDLLDLASIKKGEFSLQLGAVNMRVLTQNVLILIQPLIDGKKLSLENHIPDDAPVVLGDVNRLKQVMYNLLGNAVKFTDQGHVRVTCQRLEKRLEVRVYDTGVGIPPGRLEKIFDSFEQGDGSIARTYGGAGLGLAITRRLVELHGGAVSVNSHVGEGSVFSFDLPLYEGDFAEVKQEERQQIVPAASAGDEMVPVGGDEAFHILIVDDNPVNRQVLSNHLASHYRLSLAPDGETALKMVHGSDPVDLVLLDVMMPRLSGYEVCRLIRERFSNHELPVIFLTARNRVDDRMMGFEAGANDYLNKPVDKNELVSRVKISLSLLEVNRNLEQIVASRTRELRTRNQELETLDRVVKAINRERDLQDVLETILDEVMNLIPSAHDGFVLLWNRLDNRVELVASRGLDAPENVVLELTPHEMVERYARSAREVARGVYLMNPHGDSPGAGKIEGVPLSSSVLALALMLDKRLEGFLILGNSKDKTAFRDEDARRLSRFRVHGENAIAKARTLRDLLRLQREASVAAHEAGMAEIASEMLHNMGNMLNSVRTSSTMIQENVNNNKWTALLEKVSRHFSEQAEQAEANPQNRQLTELLNRGARAVGKQHVALQNEARVLDDGLARIMDSLNKQREFTRIKKAMEVIDLNRVLEETVQSCFPNNPNIKIHWELEPLPSVSVEIHRFRRLLFFLMENAFHSINRLSERSGGSIRIVTRPLETAVGLDLMDNGAGFGDKTHQELFSQNALTEWAGLHYCANAVKEMSGGMDVGKDDAGDNRVSLWLPLKAS